MYIFNAQKDGLAMGTSLTVITADFWLKEYEPALMKEVPKLTVLNEDDKEVCTGCHKKVKYRAKGVESKACLKLYYLECGDISESEYANIA